MLHGRSRRTLRVGAAISAAMTTVTVAHADDVVLTVPLEASMTHWSAPPLAMNGDGVRRRIVGLPVPSADTLYGLSAGVGILAHDRVDESSASMFGGSQMFLHARLAWSGPTTSEGMADGERVGITRNPEYLLEISAPLLTGGVFFAYKHLLGRVGIDWGWAYIFTGATAMGAGGTSYGGSADAGTFFVHVPLSGCVLLRSFNAKKSPFREGEDACLTFTPNVLEWGWWSGWSAGFRVDL
jgi:hypothetical protein